MVINMTVGHRSFPGLFSTTMIAKLGLRSKSLLTKAAGAGSPGPAHEYGVVSCADTPTPVKLVYPAPALANIQPVSQQ